jgi:hypothetical protein
MDLVGGVSSVDGAVYSKKIKKAHMHSIISCGLHDPTSPWEKS